MTIPSISNGAPFTWAVLGGNVSNLPTIAQGAPWVWMLPSDTNGNANLNNIYVNADTNGVIEASSGIQAAFTALGGKSGTIRFLPGMYSVTSKIFYSLSANQRIVIEGGGAVINSTIAEPGTNSGIFEFIGDLNNTARVEINNLDINHTTGIAPGTGKLAGIYIYPLNYGSTGTQSLDCLMLREVTCTGCSLVGTWILGAMRVAILECKMNSNRAAGLYITGCYDTVVIGGDFSSNVTGTVTEDYGIACTSSSFLPPCKNVAVLGVQANSNGRKGIDSHHGHNLHIAGNTCIGNGYVGIYAVMEDSTRDTGDVTIVGNTIDQTGGNATLGNYGINVGTFGNTGALSPGAFIVTSNKITGIDAGSINSHGIRVMTATTGVPPDRVVINDNIIKKGSGSSGEIILFDNALAIPYVEVCNNILHTNAGLVGVYVQAATNAIVANNILQMDSGAQYGINVVSTANAIIEGNIINGTYSSSAIPPASATQIIRNNLAAGVEIANSTFVAPFTVTGGFTIDAKGHLVSLNAGTPTFTAVNANVANLSVVGNDVRGVITFDVITGTITAGTALFNINWTQAYGNTPVLLLQDDSNQTSASFYCSGNTTALAVIRCSGALGVLTAYKVSYFVCS